MKHSYTKILLVAFFMVLTGCASGMESSAVVPVDLTQDISISNGDYDLTIYEIAILETKSLGTRKISLNDEFKDSYNLYEIRMRYINQTDQENNLSYRKLWVTVPGMEDPGDSIVVVGFCEPESDNPKGPATWCAHIPPPPKPGVFGVTGIFHTPYPKIQPGEKAEFTLTVIAEKDLSEFEISFVELE